MWVSKTDVWGYICQAVQGTAAGEHIIESQNETEQTMAKK